MSVQGSHHGAFSEEEVQSFHAALAYEYEFGYKFDCPLRTKLKEEGGTQALERYRKFCEFVSKAFPTFDDKMPSLDEVFSKLNQSHVATPACLLTADLSSDNQKKKKMRCTIL